MLILGDGYVDGYLEIKGKISREGAWSRATIPSRRKGSVEEVQASDQDSSWTPSI